MKRLMISLFMLAAMNSNAATRKWDGGGGDGLWSTAANWTGNIAPNSSDDVILDHTFLPAAYTVILPAGNISVTIRSLLIDPGGGSSIILILPSTNTAIPGLYVTDTGDALVLESNAVLRNSSGASSGTGIIIEDVFRINNGGRYIHNTNRASADIVSSLSTDAGTELGIFELDVPGASYTLSLSGRTYGTLVLSSVTRGGTVNYSGTGANALHINGDLFINSSVSFRISMTADCIVHRNYYQAPSSTFDIQTSAGNNFVRIQGNVSSKGIITRSGSGLPILQMNGLVNQNISIDTLLNAVTFSVNNPAGITLTSPLIIPYHLQFVNGKIRTNAAHTLTIKDNAVHTGSSATSFIEGPLKKIGDEDFYFPVGKGSIYTPVVLARGNGAMVTDEFTVEYIRTNPQSLYGTSYEAVAAIHHISYVEHWTISSNTGTAVSRFLTLPVNCESFCRDFNSLFIAQYDAGPSRWKTAGWSGSTSSGAVACPGYRVGTISSGPVSAFTVFTLASSQPEAVNPLPVDLVAFNVSRISSREALITWQTTCCETPDFELERAGKDRHFTTIARISGNPNNFLYKFEDIFPAEGISYYRLKIIDNQQNMSFSKVVTLINNPVKVDIISLLPAVVSSETKISVVSPAAQPIDIVIMDIQGRVTRKQHQLLQAGTTTLILRLSELQPGIYYLFGIAAGERTEVIPFYKN